MKINRSHQRALDRSDALQTKAVNKVYKAKERARRDARMVEKLRAGGLPYAPPIMSWLSRKLDKKSAKVTQQDVQTLMT